MRRMSGCVCLSAEDKRRAGAVQWSAASLCIVSTPIAPYGVAHTIPPSASHLSRSHHSAMIRQQQRQSRNGDRFSGLRRRHFSAAKETSMKNKNWRIGTRSMHIERSRWCSGMSSSDRGDTVPPRSTPLHSAHSPSHSAVLIRFDLHPYRHECAPLEVR